MARIVTLAFVGGLVPATALAQLAEPRSLVDSSTTPTALLTFDVDGDGDEDVVTTASEEGRIVWFESRGALGVGPPRTLVGGLGRPHGLAAGDADGDGDLDLLVSDPFDPVPLYLENTGPASFAAPVPLANLRLGLSAVALDDADADGDLDAIVLFPGDFALTARLFVMAGDGAGAFGAPVDVLSTPITLVLWAELRDVDGDGATDAIFSRSLTADSLLYLRSTGGGSLGPPVVLNPAFTASPLPIDTGDVDGDGDVDLVTGAFARAVVHLNDGTGQLGAATALTGSSRLPEALLVADLDLDGDDDVLAAQGPLPRLVLHESLGGGAFGSQSVVSTDGLSDFTVAAAADLDSDGAVDVAIGTGEPFLAVEPNTVAWWRGNGLSAVPPLGPPTRVTRALLGTFGTTVADTDGDGDRDLVVVSLADPKLVQFPANGPGSFGAYAEIDLPPGSPRSVLGADFDGDGRDDLLMRIASSQLSVRASLGNGAFGPPTVLDQQTYALVAPIADDLDGDGDVDVVAAPTSSSVAWYENFGGGVWSAPVPIDVGLEQSTKLATDDLDGDGDLDLGVATRGGSAGTSNGEVKWYEWTGAGFGPGTQVSTGFGDATDVVAGDLDGDGVTDLVWGRQHSFASVWTRGLGGGVFAPIAGLPGPAGAPTSVRLIDVDADGDDDLVTLSLSGEVELYESLGTGGVAPAAQPIESGVTEVVVVDVDLDGDDDLLLTRDGAGDVLFVENLSLGAVGTPYCGPAVANSTGMPGRLEVVGSLSASANVLTLRARDLPPNAFGFFLNSRTQGLTFPIVSSVGRLCLDGAIGRYVGPGEIGFSGEDGFFDLRLDLTRTPTPFGPDFVQAGETWNFQAWHRDGGAGFPSNFTDAVSVTFQ